MLEAPRQWLGAVALALFYNLTPHGLARGLQRSDT